MRPKISLESKDICSFQPRILFFANDILDYGLDINENTETFSYASKEVGLEVNVEKTKYVGVSQPDCKPKSGYINRKRIIWKYITVQVFGIDSNKSKPDSAGN
jgi:hypothetical protein